MAKPKIVVIGGGPGGEAAAKTAVSKGAEVALIEKEFLGGLCLNFGCIPSKALLETVRKLHQIKASEFQGIFCPDPLPPSPLPPLPKLGEGKYSKEETPFSLIGRRGGDEGWQALHRRKEEIIAGIRSTLQKHLQTLKIEMVTGEAQFISPDEVIIKGIDKSVRFDKAIIAGGTIAFFPPPLDQRRPELLDSRSILSLNTIPKSLLIAGGGAVGCEFACLFRELGSEITIVEMTGGLIPGEDPNVVRVLQSSFEGRGIRIHTEATVNSLEGKAGAWVVKLSNGQSIACEQILVSIGRRPDAQGLGLEKAGVVSQPKGINVNEKMQTSQPHIYAVGDITGTTRLAHAASAQGEVAATNACGGSAVFDGGLVPRCLYTWPEVASVGMWAHEAEAKGLKTKSQRSFFKGSSTAILEGETEGFFQVLSDKTTEKILGAQIIGPDATELIHIFCVAIKAEMTTKDLRSVIFAHPSLSEGIRDALSR